MKGQLKMLETVAVLLVFFFLFGFGLQFYVSFQVGELEKLRNQFLGMDADKLNNMLVSSSLLRCSMVGVDQGPCVDKYKAEVMIDIMASSSPERQALIRRLGQTQIILSHVYPAGADEVLYDISPAADEIKNTRTNRIPVSLYDPLTGSYSLATLEVVLYG
jgi:hypothetical protein